jgi:two-component system, LytTR family, sensor kinase
MEDGAARRKLILKWGLIAAGWTLFGLFFASQSIAVRAYDGYPLRVGQTIASWLLCGFIWLALTPLVLWLARRLPLERRTWRRNLPAHIVAAVLLSLLQLATYVTISSLLGMIPGQRPFFESFRGLLVGDFHFDLLTYGAVVGLSHALDYYRKYRERELRASQLETKLAQAQLDALRMQLHPHFLFNTLNSVSVLMAEDVSAAQRMLARLSDLLRASLGKTGAHEVALDDELKFLESYLEIEQTRFQDRLTVRMEIDPAARAARVPNLILQPLVENAIRHGVAPRARAGTVLVRAARRNGVVRLTVADDGPGLGSARPEDLMKGIGLSNTGARLRQLYGAEHRFELREREGGGLEVSVEIPFRDGPEVG